MFVVIFRFCDVILVVDEHRFPCHRIVLAASSLYFERMFSNGMTEASASEVTLKDVTSRAVKNLVEFAYTSQLNISVESALDTFEAADMLQFPTARLFCQQYLCEQVEVHNCLNFLLYADAYSSEPLYEKAKTCAACCFKAVSPTEGFLKLPVQHVVAILREDNIEMEYEEHVFEAMRNWVLHEVSSRRRYIPELLKCIRLNFLSRWYLIEIICKDDLIVNSEEALEVVEKAKDQLLAQGHTYDIPWQLPPSRKSTGMTEKIIYLNTHDPLPGVSEIYLFDVVNKSWSTTSQPCPHASSMSTCDTLGDSLLIIGGWNANVTAMNQKGAALNTIHEFKAMTIFPTLWYVGTHSISISRYLHSSIVVGDRLYIIGGLDETQSLQATVFASDRDKLPHLEVCPRMLYPVCRPAVSQYDDRIYVFGGSLKDGSLVPYIQLYDIQREKWSELPPPVGGLHLAYQYAACIQSCMYVFCGDMGNAEAAVGKSDSPLLGHAQPPKLLDRVYLFNPISLRWQDVCRFPEARTGSFTLTTMGGKVYITGGVKSGASCCTVDCFDPVTLSVESVGNCREGCLSLSSKMKVMHENFGL